MYRCEVLTEWVMGEDGVRRSACERDYPAVWSDITGQPDANLTPDPNALIVEGVVSDVQMEAIVVAYGERVLIVEKV